MQAVTTIGFDIAKSIFQVHGVDAEGQVVIRQQLRRGTFWLLQEAFALRGRYRGMRLVAPLVARVAGSRSHGSVDATGLCEALRKAAEERCRRRRGHLRSGTAAKHAVRADQDARPAGLSDAPSYAASVHPPADCCDQRDPRPPCRVWHRRPCRPQWRRGAARCGRRSRRWTRPEIARECLDALGNHLQRLKAQILEFDRRINAWHRSNETSRRLDELPGVGPALATALVASIPDPKAFRSGRDFSAWIGLVPKQNSSGGKEKLGNITKQGDRYLRSLFSAGALAVIRYAKIHGTRIGHGSPRCWRGAPPRSPRSRSPTRLRAWPGR